MPRISKRDANRVRNLESKIGSQTLRTLLTPEGGRILSKRRLANLERGTGMLSADERRRLQIVSGNTRKIQQLQESDSELRGTRRNRAIRAWTIYGKPKETKWEDLSGKQKNRGLRAVRALGALNVDVTNGTFYLNLKGVDEDGE